VAPFPFTLFGSSRSSNSGGGASCDFTYCYGGDWVQGKVGNYGLSFDGSGDATSGEGYVDINNSSDIPNGGSDGNLTVAAWARLPPNPGDKWNTIISRTDNTTGEGWWLGKAGDTSAQGNAPSRRIGFRYEDTGGTYEYAYSNDASNAGVNNSADWVHLVAVVTGTNPEAGLWINGTKQDVSATPGGAVGSNIPDSLVLGRYAADGGNYYASCSIDEVAIWDVPLTDAQISFLSTGSARADSITPPGGGKLMLYYDFEIADSNPVSGTFPTSTTIYDVVDASFHPSTAHTGTMTNMSVASWGDWQQGKVGKYAIQFDGTNDYIDAGTGLTSLYTDKLTVSCWVYGTFSGNSVIAAQWDYGASTRTWEMRILGNGGGDRVEIGATEGGQWSGDYLAAKSTTTISDNTWYHIVGVYDCSTAPATPKIYINGAAETLFANTSQGGAFNIGGTITPPALTIGAYLNSTNDVENLAGKIDELSIWSGELSSGEVSSLYNSGAGARADSISPGSATLIAYYDMECPGPGNTTLTDQTDNGNNGTFDSDMTGGTCGEG